MPLPPCCIAGIASQMALPLAEFDLAHTSLMAAESDAEPELCMGIVTSYGVDDLGEIFWLITSSGSEDADAVVFHLDLLLCGITELLQLGDVLSFFKVRSTTSLGQELKRVADLTVFVP